MERQKEEGPQPNTTGSRWEDRPIVERLLLSLIDANPGPEFKASGKSRFAARERRLKKAMSALFNVGTTAKGEQLQTDNRALWWMASQHHKGLAGKSGRFTKFDAGGMNGHYSPRTERQLAKDASNYFHGPFDENVPSQRQQRDSVAERLRKKWRQQRDLWLGSFLFSDNVDQLNDMHALIEIWVKLRAASIEVVPNWSDGDPISEELAKKTGLRQLIELVTSRPS
jgi:hypothetical protein